MTGHTIQTTYRTDQLLKRAASLGGVGRAFGRYGEILAGTSIRNLDPHIAKVQSQIAAGGPDSLAGRLKALQQARTGEQAKTWGARLGTAGVAAGGIAAATAPKQQPDDPVTNKFRWEKILANSADDLLLSLRNVIAE